MHYRFFVVCPNCGKESYVWADLRLPNPRVNCGACLMDHVEVVELKIVKVEESD